MIARWNDSLCTGNVVVDDQHRELFRMTNELSDAIVARHGQAMVGDVLERLLVYVDVHFAEEERLMRRSCYPELARHGALHQACRTQAEELARGYRAGELVLPITVANFLVDWLEGHIRVEDRALVRWLAITPPDARRRADRLDSSS